MVTRPTVFPPASLISSHRLVSRVACSTPVCPCGEVYPRWKSLIPSAASRTAASVGTQLDGKSWGMSGV